MQPVLQGWTQCTWPAVSSGGDDWRSVSKCAQNCWRRTRSTKYANESRCTRAATCCYGLPRTLGSVVPQIARTDRADLRGRSGVRGGGVGRVAVGRERHSKLATCVRACVRASNRRSLPYTYPLLYTAPLYVQDQGRPCGWQQGGVALVRGSAPSASLAVPSVDFCVLALQVGGQGLWSRH